MVTKTFTVAGIATDAKGRTKVRYANDLNKRLVVLFANKFTNINFVELPQAMNKMDACEHLLTLDKFKGNTDLIKEEIRRMNRKLKVTPDDILNAIKSRQPLAV